MSNAPLALLMGGGVMPGRGVDQLLHQPFLSTLHKNWVCVHSTHHPFGIEMYQQPAILYGSGDLLNDDERITAPKSIGGLIYQQDLTALYSVQLRPLRHDITRLVLILLLIRKFPLQHPSATKGRRIRDRVAQVSNALGFIVFELAERFFRITLNLDKESTEMRSADMESTDTESTDTESTDTGSTDTGSIRDAL